MEEMKYNIHIQHAYGMSVGDNSSNAMEFNTSTSFPAVTCYQQIIGDPPLTDIRSIQQRTDSVKEMYTKLVASDCNGLVLTGIAGVGKSTLAALIYRYAQEQPVQVFTASPLWLRIEPSTSFVDLLGSLYHIFDVPLPPLTNLSPANQAHELFHLLSTTTSSRLIVLDQFEHLLDEQTGKTLSDRTGVAEWLDVLNSQPLRSGCCVLLTSRLRPQGRQIASLTYLQEYHVKGLSMEEGTELLQKRGVEAAETEIHFAVDACEGHGLSLSLLIDLVQDYRMPLASLLEDRTLWLGDTAVNLLDVIWQKMQKFHQDLLWAFSVYLVSVPIDAAVEVANLNRSQALIDLRILLNQHLIQPTGKGEYQVHPIVRDYVQFHIAAKDHETHGKALQQAHAQAARYCARVGLQAEIEGRLNTALCM
jgi:NACHT domain